MNSTPKRLGLAIAVTLGLASMQSHAALITQWNYTATIGWDTTATSFTDLNGGPDDGSNNYVSDRILSWGAPGDALAVPGAGSGRSALHIDPNTSLNGTVDTNGGFEESFTITHYNNVVPSEYQVLDKTSLRTTLLLEAAAPASEAGKTPNPQLPPLEFAVNFEETYNITSDCGFPEAVGDPSCSDIFEIDFEALSQTFEIDGITYTVSIDIPDLIELSEQAAAIVGATNDPAYGIITQENQANAVDLGFKITAAVPTPGSLALFGAGIIGLGFVANRRRRSRG